MGFGLAVAACKHTGSKSRLDSDNSQGGDCAKQMAMTPKTVAQLRQYGVTDQTQLRLEYFFYTKMKDKAAGLSEKLSGLGYSSAHDRSASDPKQFVVSGWTTRMAMDEETVLAWTRRMCDLAREHKCEFDGWGTNPEQAADAESFGK